MHGLGIAYNEAVGSNGVVDEGRGSHGADLHGLGHSCLVGECMASSHDGQEAQYKLHLLLLAHKTLNVLNLS